MPDDSTRRALQEFVEGLGDAELVARAFTQYYIYFAADAAITASTKAYQRRLLQEAERQLKTSTSENEGRGRLRGFLLNDMLHRAPPA